MPTAIIQYDHVDDAWEAYVGSRRCAKEDSREGVIKAALEVENISGVTAAYPYFACGDCEHIWPYTGNADRPTCPNCRGKKTRHIYGEGQEDGEVEWPDHEYEDNLEYFFEEIL